MRKFDYDFVVIGSGAAGGTAALMAAGAGLKTAIVEAKHWGGTNVNRRDIPYAAASFFSQNYKASLEASRFGLNSANLKYNYPSVLNWTQTAARRAGANSKKEFEEAGVKCIEGFAQFIGPNEISVTDHENITAKKFLIATGSTPVDPNITGVKIGEGKAETGFVKCMLPEDVLTATRLPKVVMVVGGGATGCEIAEYLAEMGSKVLIAEISERLLPKEDPEVGEVIEKRFSKSLGVKVLVSSRVLAVENGATEVTANGRKINVKKVTFMNGGKERSVKVESVVICTGSKPAVDLGLENAKVKYNQEGIKVSKTMQTSEKHIFAAGDVAIQQKVADRIEVSSTEKASYEAAVATSNVVNRNKGEVDYTGFVRMTGTNPKVAVIGLTEDECQARDLKYRQTLVPLGSISASNTCDFRDGFVKIIISKKEQKIIGATVMAPHADIIISELVLAMKTELKILDFASVPRVATSWSEAVHLAARRLARG